MNYERMTIAASELRTNDALYMGPTMASIPVYSVYPSSREVNGSYIPSIVAQSGCGELTFHPFEALVILRQIN